ncbi:MAG TPA: Crp/Fnr family transcriptional regulator [Candidatus Angelobacter sp.]|jgi:CRP-like cAMP-binding protein
MRAFMTFSQRVDVHAQFKSPFFDGLAPEELSHVLSSARECRYRAGAIVASQGTPANSLYVLVKGRARFFLLTPEGHKIVLMWLPVGEVVGGAALQSRPSDYIVSTETVKDSTILVWDKPAIRRLAIRYPRLLDNALNIAAEYFTFYVATHVALTCHTAPQRLAAILVNLAQGVGHKVPTGVELDVTNEELAQAANVTHFTASRLLSHWQRQGALVKSRGKILLRSPEDLLLAAA